MMAVAEVYRTGWVKFMGVDLETAPGALVPRPETELLGRTAVELMLTMWAPRFIDMCCGSGNLACGITRALPTARAWASDLTDSTVGLARRNVARLGLSDRVVVSQGDLFASLVGLEPVDVVVCNPPYISTGKLDSDRAVLLAHEPREAFDGGPYGLSIHQRLIRDAVPFVKPGGWLLFELGQGQERQVEMLLRRVKDWDEPRFEHDANGNPRVAMAQRRG